MIRNTNWKWVGGGVLCAALLGAALSGCGQNNAPDTTTTTPTNATTPMDDNKDNGKGSGEMPGGDMNNKGRSNHPMPNEGMNGRKNPSGGSMGGGSGSGSMPGGSGGGGMGNR